MKLPWMKFFPNDWKADDRLRICSIGARGLWLELISMAHEAEPYGYVLINSVAPTNAQIARIVGEETETISELLSELKAAGVFSLSETGVMYCRRMVREAAKSEKNSANGKKGGRPRSLKNNDNKEVAFKNESEIKANEKPNIKPNESENLSETKALEARSQRLDYSVPNGTGDAGSPPILDVGQKAWNFGYELLASYEIPKSTAGKLLGKWLKIAGSVERLLEVLQEAAKEKRGEIVPYVEAFFAEKKKPTVQGLGRNLQSMEGGPFSNENGEFHVSGWAQTLGIDAVAEQMLKAKSAGWDRAKTMAHLNSLAAGKTRDNYQKPKETLEKTPPAEDPNWVAVQSQILKDDPKARAWLAPPYLKSVFVNGKLVRIRISTKLGIDQIKQNYQERILELFKVQKPGIENVEVEVGL